MHIQVGQSFIATACVWRSPMQNELETVMVQAGSAWLGSHFVLVAMKGGQSEGRAIKDSAESQASD